MSVIQELRRFKVLTTTRLAKRLGYERANDPRFMRRLERLQRTGRVRVFRSGYRSEPKKHHRRVVTLVEK